MLYEVITLLLAVLEQRSEWVTNARPSDQSHDYPMMYFDVRRTGLYRQLAWAANNLNRVITSYSIHYTKLYDQ